MPEVRSGDASADLHSPDELLATADRIDTTLDMRNDARGKDPDTHSATLRRYHKRLWSKPLPNGFMFDLVGRGSYLYHESTLGEFCLASDSVIQTFIRWESLRAITSQLTERENKEFFDIAYTIGGMMVFPANRVDGKQTINGARGFKRAISDRMDLTLECIRRHYLGQASPLAETLARYAGFFHLFDDFRGYVDFFLLQDLVSNNREEVRMFMPFDNFKPPAVPKTVDAYREYRRRSIDFIRARNRRIDQATGSHS
jgi:hypothetical protein